VLTESLLHGICDMACQLFEIKAVSSRLRLTGPKKGDRPQTIAPCEMN